MGYRPSVQEALDPVQKSGVYVRCRSGVGSYEEVRHHDEFGRRRGRAGLYVLARRQAQIRLVSRTGLRLQLWPRARTVLRHQRGIADRDPATALNSTTKGF